VAFSVVGNYVSRLTPSSGRDYAPGTERGLTLVPLRLYFKDGRAKIELGLGRGRKLHDKRSALRERDIKREMDQDASQAMKTGGGRRSRSDRDER
jgi:SsrA-binding protein